MSDPLYVFQEIFGDKWLWSSVAIKVWAGFLVADAASGTALFGGFFVFMTVPLILAIVTVYFFHRRKIELFNKAVAERLPFFEKERRQWLVDKLQDNPAFLTNCFECFHYHEGRAACSLQLSGRSKMIRLPGHGANSFCLYWNLADEPVLLADDRSLR